MRIELFDARTDTDSLRACYRIQLAASARGKPHGTRSSRSMRSKTDGKA